MIHYHVETRDTTNAPENGEGAKLITDDKVFVDEPEGYPHRHDTRSWDLVMDDIVEKRKSVDGYIYEGKVLKWTTIESQVWKNTTDTVAWFKDRCIYSFKCDCGEYEKVSKSDYRYIG